MVKKTIKKNMRYIKKTRKKRFKCYKDKPKDFIFGYGSIISTPSRLYTGDGYTGYPIPVQLSKKAGFIRVWDCKKTKLSKKNRGSFLALKKSNKKSTNIKGVLFPIFKHIKNFDQREKGYKRIKIQINTPKKRLLIKSLHDSLPDYPFNIYIYVTKKHILPSENCEISQQYLDIILTGCLEYSVDFAKHLLKNTFYWKGKNNKVFWINDRKKTNPRKYNLNNINYTLIDKILKETIPQYFKHRINII